jgi:peptidoglycan/LPS O-acetylase OafA/YrhL
MGAFIALAASRDPQWIGRHRRLALGSSVLALALLVSLSILPSFRAGANSILFNSTAYSLSAVCLGGTLIYVLGLQKGLLHTLLTSAPLTYLGLISYTFYLYHEAVLLQVSRYLHSPILIALAAFAVTVLISMLSWHLFEAPILGRSTKRPVKDSPLRPGDFGPIRRPVHFRRTQSKIVVANDPCFKDV